MLLIMQAEKAAFDEAEKKREEEVQFYDLQKDPFILSIYYFVFL